MLEVELLGDALADAGVPSASEVRTLCELAAASRGVGDGHVAVEFVREQRIAELNGAHRHRPLATDVLSFPVDGTSDTDGAPRELGDVVICPAHTSDMREAVVHGMLHLLGMDHELDGGEMLAVQRELLAQAPG